MNDIKFIRDDLKEKKIKQLQEVLDIFKVKTTSRDVQAATRFFYVMLKSAQEISEKKKEEEEKRKKIQEIGLKQPPQIKGINKILTDTSLQHIHPSEIPIPLSEVPKPEEDDLLEIPKPIDIEEFKKIEEQHPIEDIVKNISDSYPLILFKNTKNETVAQTNIVKQAGKLIYELTEPEIDLRIVKETKKLIQKKIEKNPKLKKDETFLTKSIKKAFKTLKIDYTEKYKDEIKYFLLKNISGLGKIDSLIQDPNIKTIICDGINKPVKITLGPGLGIITNITYSEKEEIDQQIKHLGLKIKQEVSENHPVIEGRFYHFKIQATLGLGEVDSKFIIKKMP